MGTAAGVLTGCLAAEGPAALCQPAGRPTAAHLRQPLGSHGWRGWGGPRRLTSRAGLAHSSPVGGLRLSFTSRHCCQQQEPARVHPSHSCLPACRLVSEDPQGPGAGWEGHGFHPPLPRLSGHCGGTNPGQLNVLIALNRPSHPLWLPALKIGPGAHDSACLPSLPLPSPPLLRSYHCGTHPLPTLCSSPGSAVRTHHGLAGPAPRAHADPHLLGSGGHWTSLRPAQDHRAVPAGRPQMCPGEPSQPSGASSHGAPNTPSGGQTLPLCGPREGL